MTWAWSQYELDEDIQDGQLVDEKYNLINSQGEGFPAETTLAQILKVVQYHKMCLGKKKVKWPT